MIFKALIQTFLFFATLFYIFYVFFVSEPCTRIERSTKPIYIGGVIVQKIATPWASEQTLLKIRDMTFKAQLKAALIVRKQFYYNAEDPVVCQWDASAHIVGGQRIDPVEYYKQKEIRERQKILEEARAEIEREQKSLQNSQNENSSQQIDPQSNTSESNH